MKKIGVELSACYGGDCCGFSYSSDKEITIDVDDTTYQTLVAMKQENEEIDTDVFQKAIKAGHKELKKLLKKIKEEHTNMQVEYWLFEADNDCIDESLKTYFYKDIKEGLYVPDPDLTWEDEEFEECDDDDEKFDYYLYKDDYLEWVNSHTDDYDFIAARVGANLNAVYEDLAELDFTIILSDEK